MFLRATSSLVFVSCSVLLTKWESKPNNSAYISKVYLPFFPASFLCFAAHTAAAPLCTSSCSQALKHRSSFQEWLLLVMSFLRDPLKRKMGTWVLANLTFHILTYCPYLRKPCPPFLRQQNLHKSFSIILWFFKFHILVRLAPPKVELFYLFPTTLVLALSSIVKSGSERQKAVSGAC